MVARTGRPPCRELRLPPVVHNEVPPLPPGSARPDCRARWAFRVASRTQRARAARSHSLFSDDQEPIVRLNPQHLAALGLLGSSGSIYCRFDGGGHPSPKEPLRNSERLRRQGVTVEHPAPMILPGALTFLFPTGRACHPRGWLIESRIRDPARRRAGSRR